MIVLLRGRGADALRTSIVRGAAEPERVWGMTTGLRKDYKIYKNLRGTVLIQYNIFNREYKAPYVDRLNSRIGF